MSKKTLTTERAAELHKGWQTKVNDFLMEAVNKGEI